MDKNSILIATSSVTKAARDCLSERKAVEIFPSQIQSNKGHPFIPTLNTKLMGKDWSLALAAHASLLYSITAGPAVFSIISSFRPYDEAQSNRLCEFRYLEFVLQDGFDGLMEFSQKLFANIIKAAITGDWLSVQRKSQLETISFPLPIYDYATFCEAAQIENMDVELTFDQELRAIKALGDRPLIVRNYTPAGKPNIPDIRFTAVNRQERLMNFSILVPGCGSLFDGSEIETNPEILGENIRNSRYYAVLSEFDENAYVRLENYVKLFNEISSKRISKGGFGLERLLQFLFDVPDIEDAAPFSRSSDSPMSALLLEIAT